MGMQAIVINGRFGVWVSEFEFKIHPPSLTPLDQLRRTSNSKFKRKARGEMQVRFAHVSGKRGFSLIVIPDTGVWCEVSRDPFWNLERGTWNLSEASTQNPKLERSEHLKPETPDVRWRHWIIYTNIIPFRV